MPGAGRRERPRYLEDSLARVSTLQRRARLRLGVPAGETGWHGCQRLLDDPAGFDRWRAELARWLTDRYGDAPERTTAGYVMYWYMFVPAYLAALLFHHERRVPSLRPADLAFRMADPRPHPAAIAVRSPAFACLPDDPAAGTPHATVVPDEHALAALLRGRYVAHATRFVTAFEPTVRFGRHTLWATATDALDTSLWYAGRYGGDEGAGVLDATLVLDGQVAPLTSTSTVRPKLDPDGHPHWTRRRESCCFHYLLESGQGVCASCPRLSPRESPC
ncbi:MAG TPA: (2Fe-2S)-binding protein [Actinophytocola sp.]|nr:(2Fe-2S)-binding protein [Actinophytocola sp.]HEU5471829.1 (2Fe-2S)-binding protein [Actinophytocola sp.]